MLTETIIEGKTPPPAGAAADWTIPQHWERFTAGEHEVWDTLFARQEALLASVVLTMIITVAALGLGSSLLVGLAAYGGVLAAWLRASGERLRITGLSAS